MGPRPPHRARLTDHHAAAPPGPRHERPVRSNRRRDRRATIRLALAGVLLLVPPPLVAQRPDARAPELRAPGAATTDSLRRLLDHALVTSNLADFDLAITLAEAQMAHAPDDSVALHYLGFALFRKASVLLNTPGGQHEARPLLQRAEEALTRSEATLPWPETRALRASVTGQLIGGGGPFGAMRLGPRVARQLDEAIALAPDNPRVWMLKGVASIHRPRMFGGGLDRAEAELKRAVALFANDHPVPPLPAWGEAETHGWLGQVYARRGRIDEARAQYDRALALQPGNAWVRELVLALDRQGK